ncbi:peptidase A24A prepilin type IV [Nitrosococcus halophilus Nc 4]|uniref:Peptidase A24A prepilin type IV n=1 Tax=Nitrosococcus halophilus (strain Nc4) TaxID=472759 RepID=D5C111_NITHN|nr:prepilin peptidase [Nitrosococcus halophilus]ADE14568.1 peptidase A24A prepilin type IV [Nitrosococcus halophilus Nc 4]
MLTSISFTAFSLLGFLLAAASYRDLKSHRIPNVLTFGGALLGLILQVWFLGLEGLLSGLGGLTLGLLLYLPFYLLGGMGAGDVKLLAAVGAFLGAKAILWVAILSLLAGSVIGMGVLLVRGIFLEVWRPYATTAKFLLLAGTYIPPEINRTLNTRFPYAVAIAAGTLGAVFLLSP